MKLYVGTALLWCLVLFSAFGCVPQMSARPDAGESQLEQETKKAYTVEVLPGITPPGNRYYHYAASQFYLKKGEFGKAIKHLKMALDNDPDSLYLHKELADIYIDSQDIKQALFTLESILEIEPENTHYLATYAALNHRLGNLDEAILAYEKILNIDPEHKDAYYQLGTLYYEKENLDSALRVFEQMVSTFPDSYAAHYYLGWVFLDLERFNEAEKEFEKSLEIEPDLLEPRFNLLTIYKVRDEQEKMENLLLDIREEHPDNIKAQYLLAEFYLSADQADLAEPILEDLGKQSTTDKRVLKNFINVYLAKEQYETAIPLLEGMMKGVDEISEIAYFLGICHDGLNQPEQALAYFRKVAPSSHLYRNAAVHASYIYQEKDAASEAIPYLEEVIQHVAEDASEFYIYLGAFYDQVDKHEKAVAVFKEGIEKDPENSQLYFRLGITYDNMGKKDECIRAMKESVRLNPEDPSSLNYLGYTYAEMGINLDEAQKLIEKALSLKPGDSYITDSLAWVYYQKGQYEKALTLLTEVASASHTDPVIMEHLGDTYLKLDHKHKALDSYRKALEMRIQNAEDTESIRIKIEELEKEIANNSNST